MLLVDVTCSLQAESVISVTHGTDRSLYHELQLLMRQCVEERQQMRHTAMITAD